MVSFLSFKYGIYIKVAKSEWNDWLGEIAREPLGCCFLSNNTWSTKCGIYFLSNDTDTDTNLRDVAPPKKRENVGIFPKSGTPPSPLFGNFFPILLFIFGGSPMLKTVKKNGSGVRVDPPPLFFQNSHIFPFLIVDLRFWESLCFIGPSSSFIGKFCREIWVMGPFYHQITSS